MAKWPERSEIPWLNPIEVEIETRTLMSSLGELGEEKRRQKRLYPRRNLGLSYRKISIANARTLWQFYLSRKGQTENFNVFLGAADTYAGEYVGTGDGTTTVFNLPCKSSSARTLKLDGVSQSEGTDWTFSAGGGADGADKATFAAAPAAGSRITLDFTGDLKVRSRFLERSLSLQQFYDRLVTMGIKTKGVLNA